ncbi:unnamed protein product [Rotaria sp. Silwood2]|nr:unnamed protein product [Rotaria sp. Silwood2]CAF4768700.1 unnamed protein product [Rotaria sp. Silwood2]
MDLNNHFEDLSNEIFFEIFDIFTGFTLLNRRISYILQSIPLYIIISKEHCRRQINFLSFHLTFHQHQVISIKVFDTIDDDSSIISLLFNRHNFINLKLCEFLSINAKTKLDNVIKQIKSLNTLVIFQIYQADFQDFNDIKELTRTILTQIIFSSFKYTSISLSLFRHINVTNDLSPMNENDFPILSQLISFKLTIIAIYDIQSISYILHCVPNLKHFYFHFITQSS